MCEKTNMGAVLVLGASVKPARHSNQALVMLGDYGYPVIAVNPYHREIAGLRCLPSILEVEERVDTVTVYLNPTLLAAQVDALVALAPRRIVFNPGSVDSGAESATTLARLTEAGIDCLQACTLVLLRTSAF